MRGLLVFVTVLCGCWLASAAQYDSQILSLFSNRQFGDGTYYGYTSGGSCTLDPTPRSGQTDKNAAINAPQYYGSATCGMCLQLIGDGTGSGSDPIDGTYIVYVNNLCPECATGSLDLGDSGDGRWDINWIAVPCPGNIGNLQYMAQGSHEFYIKLQVRNHRLPVSEVRIKQGSSYVTLVRTADNFFVSGGDVTFPLPNTIDIQVVSIDGQVLNDQVTIANIKSGQPFNSVTGVQFAADVEQSTGEVETTDGGTSEIPTVGSVTVSLSTNVSPATVSNSPVSVSNGSPVSPVSVSNGSPNSPSSNDSSVAMLLPLSIFAYLLLALF